MKIHKNDMVLIISGKDKNRKGKVIASFPAKGKVVVEGINLRKKHVKPKRSGEKGQIIEMPVPLDVSNVKLICPKCGKITRIGYKTDKEKKYRVCKKCGAEI
jgi:large subunit ribosomal protein L24